MIKKSNRTTAHKRNSQALVAILILITSAHVIRSQDTSNSLSNAHIDSLVEVLYDNPIIADSLCTNIIHDSCIDDESIFLVKRISSIAKHFKGDFLGSIYIINDLKRECNINTELNEEYGLILELDLSTLYSEIGFNQKALNSYLNLLNSINKPKLTNNQISNTYINLASIYTSINDFETSNYYLLSAKKYYHSLENADKIRYHAIKCQNNLISTDTSVAIQGLLSAPLTVNSLHKGSSTEQLIIKTLLNRSLNKESIHFLTNLDRDLLWHHEFSNYDPPDVIIDYLVSVALSQLRMGEGHYADNIINNINDLINERLPKGQNRFTRSVEFTQAKFNLRRKDTLEAMAKLKNISENNNSFNNTDLINANLELARIYLAQHSFSNALKHLQRTSSLLNEQLQMYSNELSTNRQSLNIYNDIGELLDETHLPNSVDYAEIFEYACHSSLIKWHTLNNINRRILGPLDFQKWLKLNSSLKFINRYCDDEELSLNQCFQIQDSLRNKIRQFALKLDNRDNQLMPYKDAISRKSSTLYLLEGINYYHFAYISSNQNFSHKKIAKDLFKPKLEEYIKSQRSISKCFSCLIKNSELIINTVFPEWTLLGNSSHLTIIPDGDFHKLAFESLLLPGSTESAPIYLIDKTPISYSLGLQLSRHFQGSKPSRVASFSPSFGTTTIASQRSCASGSFSQLLCNHQEASSSAALLNGDHFDGVEASVENFINNIPNYDLIHLASHACVDTSDYLNSRLILNDGVVSIRDLYSIDFNGKTIILSACSTAEGQIMSGEGVFNLVRVLTELGCKDMIVSLWPIDDCETFKLLNKYFSNIAEGIPPAIALQKAKTDYIKSADKLRAQPFFWAPLIYLSNDITTPQLSISYNRKKKLKKSIALVVGVGSLLVGFYIKKRRDQAIAA